MITLSRGLNPHETAWAEPVVAGRPPFALLHGSPSYINVLDALGAWEAVGALRDRTGVAACASFKHTSPAGIALGRPFAPGDETFHDRGPLPDDPLGRAVVRARHTAPKCSYGDFVAVSEPVTAAQAPLFANAIGVIAPDFAPETLADLSRFHHGRFILMRGHRAEERAAGGVRTRESVETAGLRLTRSAAPLLGFAGGTHPECGTPGSPDDLAVAVAAVRHAQSNAMAFVVDGATIGIGMGQQNRLDCTRLAAARARTWQRRRHPDVLGLGFREGVGPAERAVWRARLAEGDLTPSVRAEFARVLPDPRDADREPDWTTTPPLSGVTLAADNHFPFVEVVEIAARLGVTQLVTPAGSTGADALRDACDAHGMSWIVTGERFFRH
ncbi:phosphoribosylaminoimidazolecarboxamide formyltransferase [Streptomyces rameus]|uniref:Phosphoribosylaminoimidazolecarboxamide formyltransferase n=1 Tax=Streptomyces rameus TaxID=68261 RepID=A0ABP6ML28_9ACTN